MKVVTFGELMMRLATAGDRFEQASTFSVSYGGGEANVAISLSCFGLETSFVSKLPDHELGQAALNALRRYGVDTRDIVRGGEKLGIYYLERGIGERCGKIIYDRKTSAFALSSPSEYRWEHIFKNANWFHVTGITPALSPNVAQSTEQAMKEAKGNGLTISFDPNFRSALWNRAEAKKTLCALTRYADVLITNAGQAEDIYGIKDECDEKIAERLSQEYGCRTVALTSRSIQSASRNLCGATLFSENRLHVASPREIEVIERVGAGDAFAAGLIYALAVGMDGDSSVKFALASANLKHSISGDYNLVTVDEVQNYLAGHRGIRR